MKYSFIAVLPMFLLGVDYYRWMSFAFINLFILLIYFNKINLVSIESIKFLKNYKLNLVFIILITFVGPIGVADPIPYMSWIVKYILS